MTKKSQKTTTKQPEPAKTEEPKESKEVTAAQHRMTAFGEGMRFLIVLAENNLAKQLKLPDRNALSNDGRLLPSWWLATLMQCYDYLPAKPIQQLTKDKAAVLTHTEEEEAED